MSYGYFFKCFKKAMGVSLIQYRDQLRLAEEGRLLLSGMSIKETALPICLVFPNVLSSSITYSPFKVRVLNHPPV